MRGSPEDGMLSPLELEEKGESDVRGGSSSPVGTLRESPPSAPAVLSELIREALAGTMPVARPLRDEEMPRFTPRHIQIVFDSVQGPMTNTELADKYQLSARHIWLIIHHPFSDVLKAALLSQIADNLTDPIERIRSYTHEMLDIKVQLVRDPGTAKVLKDRIASDILDRAGYGARKTIDINKPQAPQLPAPLVERFTNALEASQRVRSLPYDQFTQRVGGNSGESAVKSAAPAEMGADQIAQGNTSAQTEDLPVGSRLSQPNEKVA